MKPVQIKTPQRQWLWKISYIVLVFQYWLWTSQYWPWLNFIQKNYCYFWKLWLFGNPNGRNLFLVNQKDRLRVFALILHIFVALEQILSFWYKIVMTNQVITYLINHLSCFIWVTVYRFCGEGFRIFFKKSKCKHILKLTIYRNLKWNIALSSIWLLFQQKKW